MTVFPLLVIVHALAATVWTGGHLVLDLGVLPRALRAQSAAQIRAFEAVFEPLGLTALAIQVLTGLWMSWIYLPALQGLFDPANTIGMLVGVKLLLLAGTAALAVHAWLRLIPNLTDENLSGLAWHIRGITALAIAFVVVGGLIRLGGGWAEPCLESPAGIGIGSALQAVEVPWALPVSRRVQDPDPTMTAGAAAGTVPPQASQLSSIPNSSACRP